MSDKMLKIRKLISESIRRKEWIELLSIATSNFRQQVSSATLSTFFADEIRIVELNENSKINPSGFFLGKYCFMFSRDGSGKLEAIAKSGHSGVQYLPPNVKTKRQRAIKHLFTPRAKAAIQFSSVFSNRNKAMNISADVLVYSLFKIEPALSQRFNLQFELDSKILNSAMEKESVAHNIAVFDDTAKMIIARAISEKNRLSQMHCGTLHLFWSSIFQILSGWTFMPLTGNLQKAQREVRALLEMGILDLKRDSH